MDMLVSHPIMRLQDFIPLKEFYIRHEWKIDEIDIPVRFFRIELNLLGYKSKVQRKFGTHPALFIIIWYIQNGKLQMHSRQLFLVKELCPKSEILIDAVYLEASIASISNQFVMDSGKLARVILALDHGTRDEKRLSFSFGDALDYCCHMGS